MQLALNAAYESNFSRQHLAGAAAAAGQNVLSTADVEKESETRGHRAGKRKTV